MNFEYNEKAEKIGISIEITFDKNGSNGMKATEATLSCGCQSCEYRLTESANLQSILEDFVASLY